MRDFFRSWKRKSGVVTLLMACVFAGGWMRSRFLSDDLELPAGTASYGCTSKINGINFYRCTSLNNEPLWTTIDYASERQDFTDTTPWSDAHKIEWRWDFAGFHAGESNIGQRHDQDCMIPYWSIVVPLTLLSAYLLLSKPATENNQGPHA